MDNFSDSPYKNASPNEEVGRSGCGKNHGHGVWLCSLEMSNACQFRRCEAVGQADSEHSHRFASLDSSEPYTDL